MDSLSGLGANLSTIPSPIFPAELKENGLPDESNPVWHAVGHLFRRQWFGRLWTFQEAVLAAELIVACGQKILDWNLIYIVAGRLWELGLWSFCVEYQRLTKLENGFKAAADVGWARSQLADFMKLDPTYLLAKVSHKTCLDPRDRVYAILGMTSLSFRNRIEISYSDGTDQHIWRTFIDCAKACIEEGLFPILELVAGRERVSDLPSWCPNFRSNPADLPQYSTYEVFSAGITRLYSSKKISIMTSRESDTLHATGFRVDVVSEIIDGDIDWSNVPKGVQVQQQARNFVEWESRRLALAQKTLCLSAKTIPLAHIFTLTSSTCRWWLRQHHAWDSDLLKTYLYILQGKKNDALDADPELDADTDSEEIKGELYGAMWHRIYNINQGRRYFSTDNG